MFVVRIICAPCGFTGEATWDGVETLLCQFCDQPVGWMLLRGEAASGEVWQMAADVLADG